ncbi:hypothetical protein B0T20DRAFT_394021 [Sordaria brevicollis]|uniref:Uncharacterized protein n=1 Tax=Sordaria brevicollis TaxID=83679 RepID=A0AAE0UAC5_SORBR|nr:hypothetical protein B0T20DRAFT_394021 [Sordaria brevicollis]
MSTLKKTSPSVNKALSLFRPPRYIYFLERVILVVYLACTLFFVVRPDLFLKIAQLEDRMAAASFVFVGFALLVGFYVVCKVSDNYFIAGFERMLASTGSVFAGVGPEESCLAWLKPRKSVVRVFDLKLEDGEERKRVG